MNTRRASPHPATLKSPDARAGSRKRSINPPTTCPQRRGPKSAILPDKNEVSFNLTSTGKVPMGEYALCSGESKLKKARCRRRDAAEPGCRAPFE